MNRYYLAAIGIISVIYIIHDVRKKRFSIKESFWWFIAALLILFLSIFPYSINWLAEKFGVAYPPSLFFVFCIVFLVLMNFRNSKRISENQIKIAEMAQQISLLKSKDSKK